MDYGFDVISDLYITDQDDFDWSGKPTSLYCIVPGNLSNDITTLHKVLRNLSKNYQGVFYIDGSFEHITNIYERDDRISQISKICASLKNVVYLHNNVVVIDGIAMVGVNGWYGNYPPLPDIDEIQLKHYRCEDYVYLERTLERLQLHIDVKKIVLISNSVPSDSIFLGEYKVPDEDFKPSYTMVHDTENKISSWVFGSYKKIVDITSDNINYVNNPCSGRTPYYPKRITVSL